MSVSLKSRPLFVRGPPTFQPPTRTRLNGLYNLAKLLFATEPLHANHPHFAIRQVNERLFYLDIVHVDSANLAFVAE